MNKKWRAFALPAAPVAGWRPSRQCPVSILVERSDQPFGQEVIELPRSEGVRVAGQRLAEHVQPREEGLVLTALHARDGLTIGPRRHALVGILPLRELGESIQLLTEGVCIGFCQERGSRASIMAASACRLHVALSTLGLSEGNGGRSMAVSSTSFPMLNSSRESLPVL